MPRLLGILVIILGIFSSVTYLLHRIVKNRYIKYIPAMITLLLSIYYFYAARTGPREGFEDLARAILSVMMMAGFLSGMATGVMLDFVLPAVRKKRKG